jgi:hypothetical protein
MGAHASLHGPLVSLFLPLSRVTRPSHRHDSTAATLLTQLPRCIVMHLSSIARAPCAMCFSLSPAACAELFPFKSRLPLPTCIFCVPSYFSEKAPPGAPSSTAAPFSLVSSTGDRVYAPNFIESPPPPPFLRWPPPRLTCFIVCPNWVAPYCSLSLSHEASCQCFLYRQNAEWSRSYVSVPMWSCEQRSTQWCILVQTHP